MLDTMKNLLLGEGAYRLHPLGGHLNWDAQHTLAAALVVTRVDYCNTVLYRIPTQVACRLQMAPNVAARLVGSDGKFEHITAVLRDVLHWLTQQSSSRYHPLLLTASVAPVQPISTTSALWLIC